MGNVKDLTGQTINYWYVIREFGRSTSGSATFLCRCLLCDREKVVEGRSIRTGASKCCGCCRPFHESVARHNERLYGVWMGMRNRCNNPNVPECPLYGGRGIKVCEEWDDYLAFKEWAYSHGYDDAAPKYQCTLDRLDTNGNYSPDNCAWHNQKEQNNNRRNNRILTLNGESHTMQEWAEKNGINKHTLRRRIFKYGWSVERALTEPVHNNGRKRH